MASMSRFALNTAPRLCFIKTTTSTAFTTSLLSHPNNTTTTNNNNALKKSITTFKTAAATVGFSTAANFRGSAPHNGSTPYTSSGCRPQLFVSKYQPLQQQQMRNFSSLNMPLQSQCSKLVHQNAMAPLKNRRYISSKEITKNMTLYTNGQFKSEVDKNTLEFKKPTGNPLVLMMAWLLAKQNHLKKYIEIYTELGFDVMVVHITPWQLLWPAKGTQVVAAEALKFLDNNKSYGPILVHGFSVGAYQFGEIMVHMSRDMKRYQHILDRMLCQVWDSAADITKMPYGFPKTVFPKNPSLESALRNYTLYHLKTFHNQATVHYLRARQIFFSNLCKKPALFFVSENDPIGPATSSQELRESWEKAGIKCTFKCWKHSQHIAHLFKHREEYLDTLFKHMEDCGILEAADVKHRAKLFKKPTGNPLVLMMAWLMAKQKHLKKYAEIYTELGFDVMVVHITPWQLLWPAKGTQVVAAETLKFLDNNKSYGPILVHGFSVGAYQLGEIMLQMSRDMERYQHILDRILCQVWDSAADITEIPVGLPKSIFPRNPRMQSALRNYTLYHMKTFHNQATIHYMRSSQMFHSTLCKKPALFFVSDNDPIGPPSSNQAVRENWERAGIKCTFKRWKHSQHAAHFIKHREEYLDTLFKHMEDCGVLEAVGVKQRAKL